MLLISGFAIVVVSKYTHFEEPVDGFDFNEAYPRTGEKPDIRLAVIWGQFTLGKENKI